MNEHEPYIRLCNRLAADAVAAGNAPFGAVLVVDGDVVLSAANTVVTERDPTRHAELNLVSRAARELDPLLVARSTLYTSTEPCAMCAGAIVWSGIPRIVYGCSAETLAAITGGGRFVVPSRELVQHSTFPPEIIGPVLEDESAAVHRAFWPDFLRGL